jgi:hypothetical protein
MANGNQILYLGMGAAHFILLGLLFFICGRMPDAMPLSTEAFSQPFHGDYAMLSYILTALLVMDLAYYLFVFMPQFLPDPKNKNHLILLVFPEIAAVFGFIIGILNQNPWGALPFFVLGIVWYAYAYFRVAQATS